MKNSKAHINASRHFEGFLKTDWTLKGIFHFPLIHFSCHALKVEQKRGDKKPQIDWKFLLEFVYKKNVRNTFVQLSLFISRLLRNSKLHRIQIRKINVKKMKLESFPAFHKPIWTVLCSTSLSFAFLCAEKDFR